MPKKTFETAESVGATLIVQVKDNQENLKKQIEKGCNIYSPTACFQEDLNKEHGRLEQRKYEVYSALPMLNKWQDDWKPIKNIVRVTRYREPLANKKNSFKEQVGKIQNTINEWKQQEPLLFNLFTEKQFTEFSATMTLEVLKKR